MSTQATKTRTATRKTNNKKVATEKPQVENLQDVETTQEEPIAKKERAPRKSKFELVQKAICEQNGISEVKFLQFVMKKFQGKKANQNKIAEILLERNLFDKEKMISEMKD